MNKYTEQQAFELANETFRELLCVDSQGGSYNFNNFKIALRSYFGSFGGPDSVRLIDLPRVKLLYNPIETFPYIRTLIATELLD